MRISALRRTRPGAKGYSPGEICPLGRPSRTTCGTSKRRRLEDYTRSPLRLRGIGAGQRNGTLRAHLQGKPIEALLHNRGSTPCVHTSEEDHGGEIHRLGSMGTYRKGCGRLVPALAGQNQEDTCQWTRDPTRSNTDQEPTGSIKYHTHIFTYSFDDTPPRIHTHTQQHTCVFLCFFTQSGFFLFFFTAHKASGLFFLSGNRKQSA